MNAFAGPPAPLAADYLCRRVIDALLREDVCSCVSQGAVMACDGPKGTQLPQALRIGHLGRGVLWLAVEPCRFMQDWRLRALPALWSEGGETRLLHSLHEILARFRAGLAGEDRELHEAFAAECQVAEEHRNLCEAERARCFASAGEDNLAVWSGWAASLLRHDRLAAFHDHPFYPTARAKLGFNAADLRAYAPEFQPVFELRWLAVPRVLYEGADLPEELRPGFAQVGLATDLAADRVLLPVHPALWDGGLDNLLAQSGLSEAVIRAPRPWLSVTPTLSVRTVVPLAQPQLHLKLPLAMRTLGGRNLRTIKPSTVMDGAAVQRILAAVVADLPRLASRLLLTDEDAGATVNGQAFLGFILRRYPAAALEGADLAPVAALAAPGPDGRLVLEELAVRHYGGDALALFDDYLDLTLRLHLTLWLRYGVALESNQQNSLVVFSRKGLQLLLKDNDAARIHGRFLAARRSDLAAQIDAIRDRRIVVENEPPLARMFVTITLQLNIAVIVEALAAAGHGDREELYRRVRDATAAILAELASAGADVSLARRVLLEAERLPLKYLLRAATLESKARTGAADVNKFYGETASNFLRCP